LVPRPPIPHHRWAESPAAPSPPRAAASAAGPATTRPATGGRARRALPPSTRRPPDHSRQPEHLNHHHHPRTGRREPSLGSGHRARSGRQNGASEDPSGVMERLLTFADVRAILGLASDRQVRRLMSAADPLPVIYVNRKQPRLHPDDFGAWLTRLR